MTYPEEYKSLPVDDSEPPWPAYDPFDSSFPGGDTIDPKGRAQILVARAEGDDELDPLDAAADAGWVTNHVGIAIDSLENAYRHWPAEAHGRPLADIRRLIILGRALEQWMYDYQKAIHTELEDD